jgi:MFS family permease
MTSDSGAASQPLASALAYPALLAFGALDAAGYSLLAPVLPTIAAATRSGPALIGLLAASFPVAMLAGFALAGLAVRRVRTSGVLLAGLALLALGCVGFALGQGLPVYLVARAAMGLGSGGLWIAVTFATLQRWPGQAYRCMSRIYAAYAVGGLLGPALGAIGGVRGPFLAYLALVAATAPLAAPLRLGAPAGSTVFRPDRAALRLPGFWLAAAGNLLAVLGLGLAEGVLPLHFASRLDQRQISALYVGVAVLVAASAARAGSLQPRRALAASAVLLVGGITLAGAAGSVPGFVAGLALAGVGIGAGQTSATGILLATVAPERIVTAMVVWSQLGILGYLAGPALGGAVAQAFGYRLLGVVPLAATAAVAIAFRAVPPTSGSPRDPAA